MLDGWLWIFLYTFMVLVLAALTFFQQDALWVLPKEIEEAPWEALGLGYEKRQDIFYFQKDTWQRKYGYCRWYDESAAPLGMIIDCEPFYFTYRGEQWLIEFWKGQYGLAAGCEVGIYKTKNQSEKPVEDLLYGPVEDEEMLPMRCVLYHNGKKLFVRKDVHWWLSGFRLGTFADPKELSVSISMTFPDEEMQKAFTDALNRAGYTAEEYYLKGKQVCISYHTPKAKQPTSRIPVLEQAVLKTNQALCEIYHKISCRRKHAREAGTNRTPSARFISQNLDRSKQERPICRFKRRKRGGKPR